jgi:hypothetical protein
VNTEDGSISGTRDTRLTLKVPQPSEPAPIGGTDLPDPSFDPAEAQRRAEETLPWHQPDETNQQIAAENELRRRRFIQADESSQTAMPIGPIETSRRTTLETSVIRAAIPIIPTLYSGEPSGGITVQNYITINVRTAEFIELNNKLNELLGLLRRSNEISGEARDQLIAEIKAGRALLEAPKADPKLLDILLKRPLMFIGKTGSGAIIGVTATAALALLGKVTGLW